MCQKIIENELLQIWKKSADLLPQALNRKSAAEVVKTDGLAKLDGFFNLHRDNVKAFLNDEFKEITDEEKSYLESLDDEIIELIGDCILEKGGYNCKQRVKYREIVIIFLAAFKKWEIADYLIE